MTKEQIEQQFVEAFSKPDALRALEIALDPGYQEVVGIVQEHLPRNFAKVIDDLAKLDPEDLPKVLAKVPGAFTTFIGLGMEVNIPEFDIKFQKGKFK